MATSLTAIGHSASVQWRVIHAMLMREILTRYGRHNIGFLWLFVEPMAFTTGVTALWSYSGAGHGSSLPIVAFALTGYSSVLLWRNMPARCIHAIEPNLGLMYHRNVRAMDVFASRLLLEAAGATVSFVTLSLVYIYLGWLEPPVDVLTTIEGWLLLMWFGASLALFLGALAERNELVDKIWHPLAYLIFPLSGAAFLVDALPQGLQYYALFIPMVNGVEMVRDGYFGHLIHAHYDVSYLVTFNLVLSFAGLTQLAIIARKITPQ
jgi:capsular polysaccharide transport system permease protein